MNKRSLLSGLAVILSVSAFFTACFLSAEIRKTVLPFFKEDGIIEYISAFFYLVGAAAAIAALFKAPDRRSKTVPLLFVVFCILCFGEETSWCQRIFNYNLEQVETVNAQGEFNIHNLELFQRDFDDNSLLKKLFNAQAIFRYVFFSYFLAVPLLSMASRPLRYLFRSFGVRLEAMRFMWVPLILIFFSFALLLLSRERQLYTILTESRETIYSICIGVHLILLSRFIKEDGVHGAS